METKGNYFLVGAFTIILSFSIILFLAWMMSTSQVANHFKKLIIYFPGNIGGLTPGSLVDYRGVQVGNVMDIKLDPEHPEHVIVTTHVRADIPLHIDTRAVIGNVGITGLAYIELETDNNNSPKLELVPGTDYYEMQGAQSRFEQIIKDIPQLVESYTHVAERLNILFDKQNTDKVVKILNNIEQVTNTLTEHQKDLADILTETRLTINDFRNSSSTSFNELDYFLRDSRTAALEIKNLAKELRANPSSLIYQPNYHGYQVEE